MFLKLRLLLRAARLIFGATEASICRIVLFGEIPRTEPPFIAWLDSIKRSHPSLIDFIAPHAIGRASTPEEFRLLWEQLWSRRTRKRPPALMAMHLSRWLAALAKGPIDDIERLLEAHYAIHDIWVEFEPGIERLAWHADAMEPYLGNDQHESGVNLLLLLRFHLYRHRCSAGSADWSMVQELLARSQQAIMSVPFVSSHYVYDNKDRGMIYMLMHQAGFDPLKAGMAATEDVG